MDEAARHRRSSRARGLHQRTAGPLVPRRTLEATPTGLAARMADRLFCRSSESNFCDEFVRFNDIFGHSND